MAPQRFTAVFLSWHSHDQFAATAARVMLLNASNIAVLSSDGTAMVFEFRGGVAGRVSWAMAHMTPKQLQYEFGISTLTFAAASSTTPAPPLQLASTPVAGSSAMTTVWIVVGAVVAVLLLVAAGVACYSRRGGPGDRITFTAYSAAARRDAAARGMDRPLLECPMLQL
jgi:hypothetical protein